MPVPAGDPELPLDIEGRQEFACANLAAQARSVTLEHLDDPVRHALALGCPSGTQRVRRVLHDGRDHVPSRGSEGGIAHCRHGDLDGRSIRVLAVLAVIEGTLDVIERRRRPAGVHRAPLRPDRRTAAPSRAPGAASPARPLVRRWLTLRTKPVSRCSAPSKFSSVVFGSALEITVRAAMRSPESSTTPHAASFSTSTRCTGASVRITAPAAAAARANASHTAPMPPSGCDSAARTGAGLRGQPVEQREHRPRGARTEIRAEHRIEAQRPFQQRRLEVLVQQVIDVHGADAQQLAHVASSETPHPPTKIQQCEPVRPRGGAELWRHLLQHWAEQFGEPVEALDQARVGVDVARRQADRSGQSRSGRTRSHRRRRTAQTSASASPRSADRESRGPARRSATRTSGAARAHRPTPDSPERTRA